MIEISTPLTGSPKQIIWAADIRAHTLADLYAVLSAAKGGYQPGPMITATVDVLTSKTDANWWIDLLQASGCHTSIHPHKLLPAIKADVAAKLAGAQ